MVWQVRMDGSDGRTDLRLTHPDSLAFYHRHTTKMDGSTLFIGALTSPLAFPCFMISPICCSRPVAVAYPEAMRPEIGVIGSPGTPKL